MVITKKILNPINGIIEEEDHVDEKFDPSPAPNKRKNPLVVDGTIKPLHKKYLNNTKL